MLTALALLVGLGLGAALLVLPLRRARAEAEARTRALEVEVESLRRESAVLEEQRRSAARFLDEFPHFVREIMSGPKERQVPVALLTAVQRALDPAQAVVLVRRGRNDAGGKRLVVAAASAPDTEIQVGQDVAADRGELAYVAEVQEVLHRTDLGSEAARARILPAREPGLGFEPDYVAPLVSSDQETLGLILLSRPRGVSGDAKPALRLLAQTGAHALQNAAGYLQIKATAQMDGLTRVFNRRHMERALAELAYRGAYQAFDRRGERVGPPPMSVFLFDIDHFKGYNEQNGHLAGDKLLQELARLVLANVRKDDVFGRFGGAVFLLVFPHASRAQACAAANKIRAVVAAHRFPFAERQPLGFVSVSGGVAEYPLDGRDAASLLRSAEEALHAAKRDGRNRVEEAAAAEPGGAS